MYRIKIEGQIEPLFRDCAPCSI